MYLIARRFSDLDRVLFIQGGPRGTDRIIVHLGNMWIFTFPMAHIYSPHLFLYS